MSVFSKVNDVFFLERVWVDISFYWLCSGEWMCPRWLEVRLWNCFLCPSVFLRHEMWSTASGIQPVVWPPGGGGVPDCTQEKKIKLSPYSYGKEWGRNFIFCLRGCTRALTCSKGWIYGWCAILISPSVFLRHEICSTVSGIRPVVWPPGVEGVPDCTREKKIKLPPYS